MAFGFGNLPSLASRAYGFGDMLARNAQAAGEGASNIAAKLPVLPTQQQPQQQPQRPKLTPVAEPQTVGVVEGQTAPGVVAGIKSPAEMMGEGGEGGGISDLLAALFGG